MKRVLSLLLLFALCFSLAGCIKVEVKDDSKKKTEIKKDTESTEATTSAKDETKVDILYKNNYTVSDEKMEKNADTVIAKVGDQTLTNEQLQVYYWMAVREYVSQYNAALSYGQTVELGFDPAQPLHKQTYDAKTGETWQQYFLEIALSNWQKYAALVQRSKDDGYVLSEEYQNYLDTFDEQMTIAAMEAGYADAEAMIDAEISKGSSASGYYEYTRLEHTALGYLNTLEATEQELEDYYKAHEADMKANGFGKDAGKFYDVRHIFVVLGDYKGEYTDAQWEECRAKAQKILDDFLANDPTEEKFAELAKKHSEDPGSASDGGLYPRLTKDTAFIPEFKDWYIDESRKPGDTGIVKNTGSSKVGYHIMYFSDSREIWKDEAETWVLNEKMTKLLEDGKVKYPMTVEYKKIALGSADLTTD